MEKIGGGVAKISTAMARQRVEKHCEGKAQHSKLCAATAKKGNEPNSNGTAWLRTQQHRKGKAKNSKALLRKGKAYHSDTSLRKGMASQGMAMA